MQLIVNDDQTIDDPVADDVVEHLRGLDEEEFLILESRSQHYMQVYRLDFDAYQLEYRAGSEDDHFGVDPESVRLDQIVQAFLQYLEQDDSYREALDWEAVDISEDEFIEEDESE